MIRVTVSGLLHVKLLNLNKNQVSLKIEAPLINKCS